MLYVIKVHIDNAELHHRSRYLCTKVQRDALVRLDMYVDVIRPEAFDRRAPKHHEGRLLELDDNAGVLLGHSLAGSNIEGNVSPSPVVDRELECDERFGF